VSTGGKKSDLAASTLAGLAVSEVEVEAKSPAKALIEQLRTTLGIELSPEQISGDLSVDGVWWVNGLTDNQRETAAQRVLYGILNRVSAKEKVAVLELALREASWIHKRTRQNEKTKRIWGALFWREVDGIIEALGSTGKKEADLYMAFERIRELRPEYRKYSFATFRRRYMESKKRSRRTENT
jgi:hypothetical protein